MNDIALDRLKRLGRRRRYRLPVKVGHLMECRLCDEPLSRRTWRAGRSWCSDACHELYWCAVSDAYLRAKVFRRDRGVCRSCGLDCNRVLNLLRHALSSHLSQRFEAMVKVLTDNGFTGLTPGSLRCLWEADHIVPLAEGGMATLDNAQTLCRPCHREKTSEQSGRRARQGRLIGKKFRIQQRERVAALGSLLHW